MRVRPARLFGRDAEERLVEIFLLSNENAERTRWRTMARPGRRAKEGRTLRFDEGLVARVAKVHDDGNRTVAFDRPLTPAILERIGHTPLPPYIRRAPGAPDRAEDRSAYQTVFAREPLAVAAPTAGLHFTLETLERIRARGVEIADLTLAVGAGTFKPVTVDDTDDHVAAPRGDRDPGGDPLRRRARASRGAARRRRRHDRRALPRGGRAAAGRAAGRPSVLDRPLHHARASSSARSTPCSPTSTCPSRRC